jgi:hypothetical protein
MFAKKIVQGVWLIEILLDNHGGPDWNSPQRGGIMAHRAQAKTTKNRVEQSNPIVF